MSDFTGTFDFAVQITGDAINRVIAANFFDNQTAIPTVYLRGTGVFLDKDLYLNTPTLALQADGTVLLSVPFVVHEDLTKPNVHGTAQFQTTLAVTANNLVLDLTQAPIIVNFDGPPHALPGYQFMLAVAFANTNSFPIAQNLPVQFGFLVQANLLHIFLSADGMLHTNPGNPPALVGGNVGTDFVVLIDAAFVQQQLAQQVQQQLGSFPIDLGSGVIVDSISLVLNDPNSMTISVEADSPVGHVTASQNFALYIDPNNPQAGISIVLNGDVSISSVFALLVQVLAPFVGTAAVAVLQQVANQAVANAVGSISPVGGQFLSETLFGMTATVYGIGNTADRIDLPGIISAEVSNFEKVYGGINPKIPMFLNNTRTYVYHVIPCYWGDQVSGKWGTFSEADATSIQSYNADPQPWDACYLCLPQLHKNRPGKVTSYFKVPNLSGPLEGGYHIEGVLQQADQSDELGNPNFAFDYSFGLTAPDAFGNIIVQNTTPQLAPGDWLFTINSVLDGSWQVQVNGRLDNWDPLSLYLTLGSQDTSPNQNPPYDPAVSSGIPGQ